MKEEQDRCIFTKKKSEYLLKREPKFFEQVLTFFLPVVWQEKTYSRKFGFTISWHSNRPWYKFFVIISIFFSGHWCTLFFCRTLVKMYLLTMNSGLTLWIELILDWRILRSTLMSVHSISQKGQISNIGKMVTWLQLQQIIKDLKFQLLLKPAEIPQTTHSMERENLLLTRGFQYLIIQNVIIFCYFW